MGVGLLCCIWLRLEYLHAKVTGDNPAGQDPIETEDSRLFSSLLAHQIITRAPGDDLRLVLPASDLLMLEKAAFKDLDGTDAEERQQAKNRIRLLTALFHSPAGSVVRSQAGLWNQAHSLTAIRDNQGGWQAGQSNGWHARSSGALALPLPAGTYVPESYGFVNNGRLMPGFSDWKAVSPKQDQAVMFHRGFVLTQAQTIQIQGIGRFVSSRPVIAPVFLCAKGKSCTRQESTAFSVAVTLPPGEHEFTIVTEPVTNQEKSIPGILISKNADGYAWEPRMAGRYFQPGEFVIASADEKVLATSSGEPTPLAQSIGLTALLGLGKQDSYALSGVLAGSGLGPDISMVQLTIDSRIQSRAQQVLAEKLETFFPADTDPYAEERKAAVVILDADTGAILAAAGSPGPLPGTHPWDVVSFSKTYPLKDPMVVRAWHGLDRHNAPGSAFKPVVALAGLAEWDHQTEVRRFVKGFTMVQMKRPDNASGFTLDTSAYNPFTGQTYPDTGIPGGGVRKIINFNRQPLGSLMEKFNARLDLNLAVQESINVWFTRLAILMDGDKAAAYDAARVRRKKEDPMIDFPDFALARTASELGFGSPALDLAANAGSLIRPGRKFYEKKVSRGDVLYAATGELSLMNPEEGGFVWILAQNAIGQGVVASPLQIARIAAAVATGSVPPGYLIQAAGKDRLPPGPGHPLGVSEKRRKLLRNAMKKVPLQGTAAKAFSDHPHRDRMFGKTGTANVAALTDGVEERQKQFFTTWFMGWREPAEKGDRRLAFACMVTHGHGTYYTGGRVCAPIVAQIVKEL